MSQKQNSVHRAANRVYTQNPTVNLPVTSCQEPQSTRVYGAEKRNVVVAFGRRHDVGVPRSATVGQPLGDGKNMLFL